ncbi:hypothetical protein COCVIDRAFT_83979, partial [Bipolaris victoriae FI3]
GKGSVAVTIVLRFQSLLNFIEISQLYTLGHSCSQSLHRHTALFSLVRQCKFSNFCGERLRWSTIRKAPPCVYPSQLFLFDV